jgi:hypothetical protein
LRQQFAAARERSGRFLMRPVIDREIIAYDAECRPSFNVFQKLGAKDWQPWNEEWGWPNPRMVATIEHLEWTAADHLRHDRFAGLTEDSVFKTP